MNVQLRELRWPRRRRRRALGRAAVRVALAARAASQGEIAPWYHGQAQDAQGVTAAPRSPFPMNDLFDASMNDHGEGSPAKTGSAGRRAEHDDGGGEEPAAQKLGRLEGGGTPPRSHAAPAAAPRCARTPSCARAAPRRPTHSAELATKGGSRGEDDGAADASAGPASAFGLSRSQVPSRSEVSPTISGLQRLVRSRRPAGAARRASARRGRRPTGRAATGRAPAAAEGRATRSGNGGLGRLARESSDASAAAEYAASGVANVAAAAAAAVPRMAGSGAELAGPRPRRTAYARRRHDRGASERSPPRRQGARARRRTSRAPR